MYASPPIVKARNPADPVDDDASQEGRRDLDERSRADDQPDLRVGDAGLCERDRQRRGEGMEAGLDGEDGEGEASIRASSWIGSLWTGRRPRRSGPLAGRRVGGAG